MRVLPFLLLLSLPASAAERVTTDAPGDATPPSDGHVEPAPIINGGEAAVEDYPMTGGMLMDADISIGGTDLHVRMLVCSSTLIAPDVVLLAAHCIDPDVLTYGYGSVENTDIRWTRQADLTEFDGRSDTTPWPDDAVAAWDWVHHPDWDYTQLGMGLAENRDLALLFLDEPVLDVPYAWLVTEAESAQIAEGLLVDVVGWGQQVPSESMWEPPPEGTYAVKQMGESYINELNAFELQVGGAVEDVRKCHGDSGGPTFLSITTDAPESMRLIGVTSHAYDTSDCNETGGVDTRVDHYLAWIDEELRARCADGTRTWCEQAGIPDPAFVPEEEDEVPVGDEDLGLDDDEEVGGCACDMGGGGATGGLLVQGLVIAGLVRRRRRA